MIPVCRFTWYRTGRNAKNILVCKPFLQMQIAADQSCPQTAGQEPACSNTYVAKIPWTMTRDVSTIIKNSLFTFSQQKWFYLIKSFILGKAESYSLLSYSHRRVKQGTVLDTTESIWIPASTEYCKTKCAVWGSAESNCAKQSAVQDSVESNWILSGTAPSQTEYCPGQHWVKQS